MLESGSPGSARGASSNGRPYREPRPFAALLDRPHERARSARKRTEPERDGCANCGIRIRQQSYYCHVVTAMYFVT